MVRCQAKCLLYMKMPQQLGFRFGSTAVTEHEAFGESLIGEYLSAQQVVVEEEDNAARVIQVRCTRG